MLVRELGARGMRFLSPFQRKFKGWDDPNLPLSIVCSWKCWGGLALGLVITSLCPSFLSPMLGFPCILSRYPNHQASADFIISDSLPNLLLFFFWTIY